MTKEEAKHFSEVLKAYSEDKELEYLTMDGEWVPKRTPNFDAPPFKYRVKPELKYRPYKSAEEFLKAQKEHGPYICTEVHGYQAVIAIYNGGVGHINAEGVVKFEDMLLKYKWQDGTPCGILEK